MQAQSNAPRLEGWVVYGQPSLTVDVSGVKIIFDCDSDGDICCVHWMALSYQIPFPILL